MLRADQNTAKIEKQILHAAKKCFNNYSIENNTIHTIFEHGQWWVRFFDEDEGMDRTFSVIDADGVNTFNGFDFEEV